jgi:hypothetical protein
MNEYLLVDPTMQHNEAPAKSLSCSEQPLKNCPLM